MSIGRLSAFIHRLRGDLAAGQPGGLSDAQLLDRWLAQRDQAAFEVLLWRHGPMILSVCRRVLNHDADVEDAFQAAFLLLVRKAAAIRRRESVAAWLHQTAHRVALRARKRSAKQSARETNGVEWLGGDASADAVWRDMRPILDEEINRLPEKYRIPFIRCHLEGCTNEEAAVEMGCPVGTIHSRLAWARERLRDRLTRRGVTLTTAGVTALLVHNAASAALSAPLARTTLQAVFADAAHSTIAGASTGAVALAKEVMRSMFLAKLRLGAVVLLMMTLCVGVGAAFYHWTEAVAGPPGGSEPAVAPQPQLVAPAPIVRRLKDLAQREEALVFVATDGEIVPQKRIIMANCLATEAKPGETVPLKKKIVAKWWTLAIQENDKAVPAEERVIVENAANGAGYRKWQLEDGFPAGRLRVGYVIKTYRKLTIGDVLKKGEVLALVDTAFARSGLADFSGKIDVPESKGKTATTARELVNTQEARRELADCLSKLDAAEAEWNAATARTVTAKGHYETLVETLKSGIVAPQDYRDARLRFERCQQEEAAKKANLEAAQREAAAANTVLMQHELRAPVTGKLMVIRHQDGELVPSLEIVLDILPLEPLDEK